MSNDANGQSPSALNAALVKARREMKALLKTGNNPHFDSDFAPLDEVVEVSAGPLADNGLMVTQSPRLNGAGQMVLNTTVLHESGCERDFGDFLLAPSKPGPQEMGSAITYARRQTLCAVLGLAPKGADDDGNAAQGRGEDVEERARERFKAIQDTPRPTVSEVVRRKITTAPPVMPKGVPVARLTELGELVAGLGIYKDNMPNNEKKAAVYAWTSRMLHRTIGDWSELTPDDATLLEAAAGAGEK